MDNPYKSILATEMYGYIRLLESADRSLKKYEVTFRNLDAYLVNNNVCEKALPETLISEWLKTLTCKPQTKNHHIGNLRWFARYLTALEIAAYEPEFIRAQSDFVAYTFTDEEFAAVVEAADNFAVIKNNANGTAYVFPVLLRILYGCGLRIGEALELRWNDMNFVTEVITIRKAKNRKQRLVPISSSLAEVLRLYQKRQIKDNPNADLLFESNRSKGRPYLDWTFRNWFLKILEQADIANPRGALFDRAISPHTLRHYFTFKSFLKSETEGRRLEETGPFLAAYLGHDSLLGTEKYLTTNYTLYESSHKRMEESIGSLFPEVSFE